MHRPAGGKPLPPVAWVIFRLLPLTADSYSAHSFESSGRAQAIMQTWRRAQLGARGCVGRQCVGLSSKYSIVCCCRSYLRATAPPPPPPQRKETSESRNGNNLRTSTRTHHMGTPAERENGGRKRGRDIENEYVRNIVVLTSPSRPCWNLASLNITSKLPDTYRPESWELGLASRREKASYFHHINLSSGSVPVSEFAAFLLPCPAAHSQCRNVVPHRGQTVSEN